MPYTCVDSGVGEVDFLIARNHSRIGIWRASSRGYRIRYRYSSNLCGDAPF